MTSHTTRLANLSSVQHSSDAAPGLRGTGVGLRVPHYQDFLREPVDVTWLEVHSENYFGDGGYDLHVLTLLRRDYPISLHGVGLGLGSAQGYRQDHIDRLKRLTERIEPALVSEHLCWGSVAGRSLHDLLPMPLNQSSLNLLSDRIDDLQTQLKRRVLIENVSTYIRFRNDQMSEAEFLAQLALRTGCGIVLDINNLYVNQINHQESATEALWTLTRLPAGSIGEIHLAGHRQMDGCLIDDHGSHVAEPVWDLFRQSSSLLGMEIPVLIEWDTHIPALPVLLAEVQKAEQYRNATQSQNREITNALP
ncbi:MNIO family bufferin maturase [Undibacterium oligocarboniphilum]|uniref:DUF692 domain-containing protein n=1 Tax=Undibacterium oligocarboniphilum TaxID=666702 RepID=A0A850QGV5_9BURK|nr:DUF692 domain-containing protein [Undibacterium oligocarboniphilum]MBC3871314.1 DUF692 domain-containing protein [Undibacterium oligocarboniphilum]NVO78811.1 DUF692 domain-containing protein [Undibacterium oligocarboniphilum]